LDGETLHARLRRSGGRLSIADSLTVTLEIARGLREAHRTGIVHRDLKPGNVMLVPDAETGERVKILDFGLVKQLEGDDREDLTQEGSFLGSPKYMSPEQIDRGEVDHRADLYALGVIMFQCLCGRVPYDGPSSMQILLAHVASPIPTMKERNPLSEVPPTLEAIARKLLAKNPDHRHASAEELVRELRAQRDEFGLSARATQNTSDGSTVDAMSPEPSGSLVAASTTELRTSNAPEVPAARSRVLASALVVAGLMALGSAAVVIVRRSRTAPRATTETSSVAPSAPVIRIESTPGGAVVSELGRNVGITPLTLPVDANTTGVRHFTLALEGYQQQVLDHAASPQGARLVANLLPAPPAVVATVIVADAGSTAAPVEPPDGPRVVRRGTRVGSHPGTTTATQGATTVTPPLEIMTER
ncbi:MAG: serine/threonine-protein kinase, partial [Deltaproteobacteria bacterium]